MAPLIEYLAANAPERAGAREPGSDRRGSAHRRQRRVIVIAAFAFAAFVFAATFLLAWQWRLTTLAAAETHERGLSVALSELMARSIDSVDILLHSVAETIDTGDLADPALARRLHEVMRERILGVPSLRALIVFDAEGKIVAFSRWHPPPAIHVEDRDYFIALRAEQTDALYIGVPTLNRINGEWTINVGRRLSHPDGSFAGVALATLEPLYYEQVYATINLDRGGTIAMFRTDGVLLARHPHAEEMMGRSVGDTEFRGALGRSTTPVVARVTGRIDGKRRIVSGRYLGAYPIYVTVSQHEDVVLAPWWRATIFLVSGMAIVLLALGFLAFRMLQQAARRETAERETLAAKLRAEAASAAKTSFLANMSHELRTPLNAILGFSEMIRDRLPRAVETRRYADYANDIHTSGMHLLDLVNDVLDMSKIESGHYQLHLATIDIANTIAGCLAIIRDRASAKKVVLVNELAAGLPPIEADERAVKQVLLNLLSNAVKFSPPGSAITIAARLTAIGELELRVADHGIGIDETALANIFEPFGRGDHMRAQPEEGIGLGLAISRQLMTLHGGALHLDSMVGAGTTATARFPASSIRCRTMAPGEEASPQGSINRQAAGSAQSRYRI